MKATFTHNGKKYIYKVDGKQVRTSQKDYPYECVAVRLYDGEFVGIIACGQYKTCAAYLGMDAENVRKAKDAIELVKGNITYKEYVERVGRNYANTSSYYKGIIDSNEKKEEFITRYEKYIEDHLSYSTVILYFEQE
jgi:hypothetical protein